jgi:hypothetical protein
MIAHVVLFRPRADLPAGERERLADTFGTAVAEIGSIRRVRVGRRIRHGRGYEALMTTDYTHVALFEFDDVAALESYLKHPAHEALAARFFAAFEVALMYDFALLEGNAAALLLAP